MYQTAWCLLYFLVEIKNIVRYSTSVTYSHKLPRWLSGEESACKVGDSDLIPGSGRSLERKWQPTPVFLPWGIPWTEEPGGLHPWGVKELDVTWWLKSSNSSRPKQLSAQWSLWIVFLTSFCSVAQSCLTPCDPMDCSMPGLAVPHHLPEFAQVRVNCIGDAIQPSHPLIPSSPSALNLSQPHFLT